jgi:hypothetical protein
MKKSELKQIVREELVISTYELMFESVNPSNHYDFEHTRKNIWVFKDRKEIQHFIIINQSLYKGDTKAEIKFGWVDNKNNKRYDKPPTYDEKIFNTHIYILLNEILTFYSEYFTEFYLEANDDLRHRLYRQTLNKFLNKSEFTMNELPGDNTLIITNIHEKI